jgi:hypothetical protein
VIELCAGTAAVTLAAIGAPRFPASRIGSKAGYAEAILEVMQVAPGSLGAAVAVEADPVMAVLLARLLSPTCGRMADSLEKMLEEDPELLWRRARVSRSESAVMGLVWLAGARGGIGGFKGAHVRRPSVDGFIPSRESLIRRVRDFAAFVRRLQPQVRIIARDASDVVPCDFRPTSVYVDPPYVGRQSYGAVLREPVVDLAQRWAEAGHRVFVSEARRLPGAARYVNLTNRRRGQTRRSLTVDCEEWLSVWDP